MTESGTESAAITWSAPECPFTIETSARVLDDIRLAVTDAFFSLPRGGAEIGGILLGCYRGDDLIIGDYAALECEHAYGPSFQLSPRDEARFTELLATHDGCAGGLRPVGWYHSHTRSEIFMSDADIAIHERFFPETWQVALVLRPHTFHPTRFGFFFREADGSVHAAASYREVQLEARAVRQMPAGPPIAPEPSAEQAPYRRPGESFATVVDLQPAASPAAPLLKLAAAPQPAFSSPFLVPGPTRYSSEPAGPSSPFANAPPPSSFSPAPVRTSPFEVPPPTVSLPPVAMESPTAAPAMAMRQEGTLAYSPPAPAELPVPKFTVESASAVRKWMTLGIVIVGGLGVAAAGYKTQQMWLPRVMAAIRPGGSAAPAPAKAAASATTLGLTNFDREGQLQINWDRASTGVTNAAYGVLEIAEEGAVPQVIQLDAASLQTGSFTYQRSAAKVDLKLVIHQKEGPDLRESGSFLGKPPAEDSKAKEDTQALKQREAEAIRQRDDMAKQTTKMKADLNFQAAKTKKLEKDMQAIREEMRKQQQRRLANQVADK